MYVCDEEISTVRTSGIREKCIWVAAFKHQPSSFNNHEHQWGFKDIRKSFSFIRNFSLHESLPKNCSPITIRNVSSYNILSRNESQWTKPFPFLFTNKRTSSFILFIKILLFILRVLYNIQKHVSHKVPEAPIKYKNKNTRTLLEMEYRHLSYAHSYRSLSYLIISLSPFLSLSLLLVHRKCNRTIDRIK